MDWQQKIRIGRQREGEREGVDRDAGLTGDGPDGQVGSSAPRLILVGNLDTVDVY